MKLQLPAFSDKRERLAYLSKNKASLIDLAKSTVKHCDAFGMNEVEKRVINAINKTDSGNNADTSTAIDKTIIGNTYLWLDSHDDVHVPGLFAKSITERKAWHLHDHLFQLVAKVGIPKSVYEKYIDWAELGINKTGQTQALFMDSNIQKELNPQIFKSYLADEVNQHSVGMRYIRLQLALDDADYKEEYAVWSKYIDQLGNQVDAEDQGYFWAVQEAKLIEISCVLEGSNVLTPTLSLSTAEEPLISTLQPPLPKFDLGAAIKQTKFFNN